MKKLLVTVVLGLLLSSCTKTQSVKVEPNQTKNGDTYFKLEMIAKVFDEQYFDSGQTTTFFIFSDTYRASLDDKKLIKSFYREVFKKTIDKCKRLNKTFVDGICSVTSVKFTNLNNSENNKLLFNKRGFKTSSSFYDLINGNNFE
jgi:hypothetical protein